MIIEQSDDDRTSGLRSRGNERRGRGERGAMTTELVVIAPALFLMILFPIHMALWWHAKQAVDLAVEEALDAAQVEGASEGDGVAVANAILAAAGNVQDVVVDVDISGDDVVVVVSGRSSYRIFPGRWGVQARAEGQVERFIGEDER